MVHFWGESVNLMILSIYIHQRPALKKNRSFTIFSWTLWRGWVILVVEFPAQTIIVEKTVSEVEVDDWAFSGFEWMKVRLTKCYKMGPYHPLSGSK